MLNAEVYALNDNGSLKYDDEDVILQFDGNDEEIVKILDKIKPDVNHANGEFKQYVLSMSRDKMANLYLVDVTVR